MTGSTPAPLLVVMGIASACESSVGRQSAERMPAEHVPVEHAFHCPKPPVLMREPVAASAHCAGLPREG